MVKKDIQINRLMPKCSNSGSCILLTWMFLTFLKFKMHIRGNAKGSMSQLFYLGPFFIL